MKRLLFLACLSFSAFFAFGQKQVLDLQSCLEMAKQNNLNIQKAELSAQQSKISNLQAKEDFLPSLYGSAGQNFYFGRSLDIYNAYQSSNSSSTSFGVNASLTLFNGLQRLNTVKQTNFDYQAALKDYERQSDEICLQVMSQYLNVLFYKRQMEIAKFQLELSQESYNKTKAQVEAGSLPKGDLIEAQAQVRSDEYSLVQAESSYQNQLISLGQLLYIDDFENFDIADEEQLPDSDLLSMSVKDIYENAIDLLPSVQAEQLRIESSQKSLKIAKGAYSPTLSFNAGYNTSAIFMDNPTADASFVEQLAANSAFNVGFSLSVPLFDRMQTPNNVKKAKLNLQDQQMDFEIAKYELLSTIQQAYNDARNAKAQMVSAEASVESNKEAYDYQKAKYESGASSVYDYNQARLNYTEALSQEIQARFEYIFRTKILSYYNGDLKF